MSIKVMNEVWEQSKAAKGDALVVLLALADWCDDERCCFPKMEQIARKARVTKRGAIGIVQRLEQDGFLTVHRGNGRGHKSHYELHPKGNGTRKPTVAKGEAASPFDDKGCTTNTVSDDKRVNEKQCLSRPAYKEEPSNQKKVLTINEEEGENAREESSDSPPSPSSEKQPQKIFDNPLAVALMEVCDKDESQFRRNPKLLSDLKSAMAFVRTQGFASNEAVAEEVRRRFKKPVWHLPDFPHLSQIETNWSKTGRALERQQQLQGATNGQPLSGQSAAFQLYGRGRRALATRQSPV